MAQIYLKYYLLESIRVYRSLFFLKKRIEYHGDDWVPAVIHCFYTSVSARRTRFRLRFDFVQESSMVGVGHISDN